MDARHPAVEGLGVRQFQGRYAGKRVLLTGHTGFKGSWLACWLAQLGAEVTGYALDPDAMPNHWDLLDAPATDIRGDVRELSPLMDAFARSRPEVVFHLAAQTLVRQSYGDPLNSWSSNVMGTANVLEACRRTPGVRAVVVITTDKVYANREWPWGYRENDTLGGHDPYSASKAACEMVVDSYRKAFWHAPDAPLVASARAGNVIGGGDWAADRLVPDLVRAVTAGVPLEIRHPQATRPWQHVLECLSGYLMLGERLLAGDRACADAWNFGPAHADNRRVGDILAALARHWPELRWQAGPPSPLHEAGLLQLDCARAHSALGWQPVLGLDEALALTAQWYRHHHATGQAQTRAQLDHYLAAAQAAGARWITP